MKWTPSRHSHTPAHIGTLPYLNRDLHELLDLLLYVLCRDVVDGRGQPGSSDDVPVPQGSPDTQLRVHVASQLIQGIKGSDLWRRGREKRSDILMSKLKIQIL